MHLVMPAIGIEVGFGAVVPMNEQANWFAFEFRMQSEFATAYFLTQLHLEVAADLRYGGSDAYLGLSIGSVFGSVSESIVESQNYTYVAPWTQLLFGLRMTDETWLRIGPRIWLVASQSGGGGNELDLGNRFDSVGEFLIGGVLAVQVGRRDGLYIEVGGPMFARVYYTWSFASR